ncbi:MAG: 50S ribosomal protein L20 [Candidatus Saccharibacteria bacterium]|nr:50S ribosomal protein L20 [Candidatus Saccharibacteria bacterium]
MRIKRSVTARKRHKKVLKATKGMQKIHRSSYRLGKQALIKALRYAYRDRRTRKRSMRQLWIIRINAACRQYNLTYSQLIPQLEKTKIELDRKSLAYLATQEQQAFETVIKNLDNI